ncbi:chemokine (C-X-C motif) ligand 18b isoform X1 [Megalobrama amblycephala]|uniref:chemokine (C-X-C motif) ligand 18b isoform X1 n=1 Tax=Megalobrama amblycephala TaxID=75352 RepID=UPI002013C989|nr:chemokine (C-X-C motif) ligand 18b isoform X1 [Megalobrama amblycephala]
MAFLPKALLLLLLAVVCIQLSGVQAEIRVRCWCPETKKYVRKETIEEFSVFNKTSQCNNVEIILTLKPVNNSNEVIQRCLNPNSAQGKNLQTCWKSRNTNNTATFKISNCQLPQNA